VTDVKTSPDLRHARVYVSILGSPEEREASVERFVIDRFPDGAVVRRLQVSAEDLGGLG